MICIYRAPVTLFHMFFSRTLGQVSAIPYAEKFGGVGEAEMTLQEYITTVSWLEWGL